ncbi:MAG: hypothetical protein LBG25_03835, partial [Spirochaetaceae bacterium]|nr:hypothetical protein [Spirochaetaceae bacterium]
ADRLVILIWGEDRANVYREGLKAAELLWHKLQSLRFKDIAIGVGEAAETLESLETSYHTAAEALAWGMLREKIGLTASVAASFAQIPTYESALYYGHSFPLVVPIVAGILAGGLFGLFNGVLVAYGKLPPFIATLGTMSIARGIQLIYTKAAIVGSLNSSFKNLAQKSIGPAAFSIPYLGIYVLIITVVIWVLLKHTRQGTNFYAIGGNAQAARVSGINVERDLVCVYFYAGLLYGAAGVLQAGRLGLANALTANGMELDAIAAVTVGGGLPKRWGRHRGGHDHRRVYHGAYQLRDELFVHRLLLSASG